MWFPNVWSVDASTSVQTVWKALHHGTAHTTKRLGTRHPTTGHEWTEWSFLAPCTASYHRRCSALRQAFGFKFSTSRSHKFWRCCRRQRVGSLAWYLYGYSYVYVKTPSRPPLIWSNRRLNPLWSDLSPIFWVCRRGCQTYSTLVRDTHFANPQKSYIV